MSVKTIILLVLAGSLPACRQFPKDPHGTLESVQNNTLVAGITENPPYVIFGQDEPSGHEVALIRAFASDLNAEVEWVKGPESTVLNLLKEGRIDVAAGGFHQGSVWKKHVYFAKPHDTLVYKWGVPATILLPDGLKDEVVYVPKASVAASYAVKAKAKVVYADSLTGSEPLVVAPEEELNKMGYHISEKALQKDRISLAIRKGENAFLERLENFISDYERKKANRR